MEMCGNVSGVNQVDTDGQMYEHDEANRPFRDLLE
jgi:hypothetical protein